MERNRIDQTVTLLNYQLPSTNGDNGRGFGPWLCIGSPSPRNSMPITSSDGIATSYAHAKKLLRASFIKEKILPALIIINLPFADPGLKGFVSFLKKRSWTKTIPVIYSEGALSDGELIELAGLQLVDDIVDIDLFSQELHQKAAFLQKAKTFLNASTRSTINNGISKSKNIYSLNFLTRRFLDIIIATALLLLLSPLLILITIAIKLESKGPAIYRSKRAGKGCKIFDFYKFRTMFDGAENGVEALIDQNLYNNEKQSPLFFKAINDPRITKVGSFLRNTSLDEVPQLMNVIRGDMSLVGNRPLPIYEASTLTTDAWAERFMAPAGITGLWQVLKRGRTDVSIEERLDLDINYARHNNISRDMWILASTPKAMFQRISV